MKHIATLLLLGLISLRTGVFGKEVSRDLAQKVAEKYLKRVSAATVSSDRPYRLFGNPGYAYLFNLSPQGFILISTEDAASPVLAWSTESDFPADHIPAGLQEWLCQYEQEIRWLRNKAAYDGMAVSLQWNDLLNDSLQVTENPATVVQPMISALWGQDFPYNANCPEDPFVAAPYYGHVPAGCGAVAMGMVMDYWRYPLTGTGSHCITPAPPQYGPQCADFLNTNYLWQGMTYQTVEESTEVAMLLFHAGVSVDMYYSSNGSFSFIEKIHEALINFFRYDITAQHIKKSDFSSATWESRIRNNLNGGRPVIYTGYGSSGGHIFICDGYQNDGHYHFTWGWKGIYNGWFLLTSLNPGGLNYTSGQEAVVDIRPPYTSYPYYCSGQNTITKYLSGSIEDGSGPIKNYPNSMNCSWLIKPDDSISSLRLEFRRFALGPADMVTIYNGDNTSAPILASFTGTSLPPPVTTSGNKLLVKMTSGFSTTLQGFLAEFFATPLKYCFNDTVLTASAGTISDGSKQYRYQNDSRCFWYILPPGAKTVTLSFLTFATEINKDVLKVYDLSNPNPIATLSGSFPVPPEPLTSLTGRMMLEFSTNKLIRDEGWSADYSITVGIDQQPGLSGLIVYPNPSSGMLTIDIPSDLWTPDTRFNLSDFTGTKVFTCTTHNPRSVISLPGLSPGLYFWSITGDAAALAGKVIIL